MVISSITTSKILKTLSEIWQSLDDITYKLQIHDPFDIKYLKLKLKEFRRKDQIKLIYYQGKKYWKLKLPEESLIKVPKKIADKHELEEYIEIKNYIDFFTQIVNKDPGDIQALDALAYYYHEISSKRTKRCLEKLIDLDPFDVETWQDLGDEYFAEKDFEKAIKSYENAFRLASDIFNPYTILEHLKFSGHIRYEKEDFETAIKFYETVLRLSSEDNFSFLKDIDLLLHLGGSYTLLRQPDDAIKYLEIILELDSEMSAAWDLLGLAYATKRNFDKAFECVEVASELDPNFNFYDLVLEEKERYIQELQGNITKRPHENQIELEEKLTLDNRILSLLKKQIDKFDKLIKISEFSAIIHIKSYINDLIRPFFRNPSNKKIKKLKKSIEQHIEGWPKERREEFFKEYFRTIRRFEEIQPTKWKKWGKNLLKIISLLR